MQTLKNETKNYVNKKGVFPFAFNKMLGLIDSDDKIIQPPVYNPDGTSKYSHVFNYINGLWPVVEKGLLGFVNEEGILVIPCIYDFKESQFNKYGDFVDAFNDKGFKLAKNNKFGLVSNHNEELSDFIFDTIYNRFNGICVYEIGGLYGYLDSEGNKITEPIYTDAYNFIHPDFALAKRDGVNVIITRDGVEIYRTTSNLYSAGNINFASFIEGIPNIAQFSTVLKLLMVDEYIVIIKNGRFALDENDIPKYLDGGECWVLDKNGNNQNISAKDLLARNNMLIRKKDAE